jgi:hypothetical protein
VERKNREGELLTGGEYEYTALGELVSAKDVLGNPVKAGYDLMGRRIVMESDDMGRKENVYAAFTLNFENEEQAGNKAAEIQVQIERGGQYEYNRNETMRVEQNDSSLTIYYGRL